MWMMLDAMKTNTLAAQMGSSSEVNEGMEGPAGENRLEWRASHTPLPSPVHQWRPEENRFVTGGVLYMNLLLRHPAMKTASLRLAALIALAAPVVSANAAPVVKPAALDTVVVAGGCFWGVQAVFQHVNGVVAATSGYAGGTVAKPSYEDVSTGNTGHAESVRVVYDPAKLSLDKLLDVFFTVAHDPTQLNRQGP